MTDEDVTTGELARNIRDMRADQQMQTNATRNDMQVAIGKLENNLNETRLMIGAAGYVDKELFEEVRTSQGQRIGESEKDIIQINSKLDRVSQLLWGAIISILVSVVGGIILAVVLAAIK